MTTAIVVTVLRQLSAIYCIVFVAIVIIYSISQHPLAFSVDHCTCHALPDILSKRKTAPIVFARQVSNAKVVTKINHITFKNVISNLDLGSVFYPRYITSEAIIAYARAKKNSLGSNIETLYHMFDSRVEAIEFRVRNASKVTNTPLMELSLKKNLLITFINRNGSIIIPSGQDSIHVGDTVMVVTTHTGFNDIIDILE